MLKRVKGVVKIKTILKELSEFVAEFDQMDWENWKDRKTIIEFRLIFCDVEAGQKIMKTETS